MSEKQINQIFQLALKKMGSPDKLYLQAAVWSAMSEFGVRGDDPERSSIFKSVMKKFNKDSEEQEEIRKAKEEQKIRDAYANEMRHPPDAYGADLEEDN